VNRPFPWSSAAPGVLDLQPYQPGKPIDELERELGIANAIKLASNENPLGPSPFAIAALHEEVNAVERYPDGNSYYLRRALGEHLGVAPQQITLGNGSNDVLDLLARTFVTPGDEVVFSEFGFLVYPLVTQAAGGAPVVAPATHWGHDMGAMLAKTGPRTKLLFIANPNNPTGTYNSVSDLRHLLEKLDSRIVVCVDEGYFEYVEKDDYASALDMLPDFPNLVVTRTFSKVYGLAGLRIGYAVASNEITDLLNRVRQPFNVNAAAQAAALAALEDAGHISRSVEVNRQQRERLHSEMTALGLAVIPSVANFLTVGFSGNADRMYQALLRAGVIVRPIVNYGMPQHLRITVGRTTENDRFLGALKAIHEKPG